MPARQRQQSSADKKIFDVRLRLEKIAIGDDDVRHLPDLDRTQAVIYAKDLRRVKRH